ncbi:SulP family inorganic anion transporter [Piscirickettsia litoralis]|uniref:Sodium-independent anion transporter n=1 Tax=Piscirickettsia litoralis TaxID=1891921 RepID=A0ABX3A0P9_9GAMM|nr:SulP family inorganic anion transporter [Piscirickettsia litoralis]ODN42439.1 sodium-independent anion transporter [Piscirickettsia litoralis]
MNKIKNFFLPESGKFYIDTFSGFTVALALIPEAIAFSLVAHVNPTVGLYAAFIMCLVTAVIGARTGMISGATGSMAVVIVALVSQYGLDYLFVTIILTGIFQVLIGIFHLERFMKILPKSVMIGFVNGLAIVIFLAQLEQFKYSSGGVEVWLHGSALWLMIALVVLTMVICYLLPKFTQLIPSALAAIVIVSLLAYFTHIDTRVVADMVSGSHLSAGLPSFHLPKFPLTLNTLRVILPYAIILTIVGLSESLMTLALIDEMTDTKGQAGKECIAQGVGNIICGFFKGMGGCAMLGQSMINVNNGAKGRLSGIVASITLLLCIVLFWPLIKMIPLAALVGVMFIVVIETFEWMTLNIIRKIPRHDAVIIVTVTMVTVATNLATAVIIGIIFSALVFAWKTSHSLSVKEYINNHHEKVYEVDGILFFGSIAKFKASFNYEQGPDYVVIDLNNSYLVDYSAVSALQFIQEQYDRHGKRVRIDNLTPNCQKLLAKAGCQSA